MSTKELREKAHKTLDAVPDNKLQRFVSIIDEVKAMLDEADLDARVKRIIDENRGLLQRLAQ
ncbi:MAG: hypothetical protein RBT71_05415 [Flavobacteriales bacterium]|jgi:hypothetical protein|nr:hypothetical protein [Flavobacteriales bacterium]